MAGIRRSARLVSNDGQARPPALGDYLRVSIMELPGLISLLIGLMFLGVTTLRRGLDSLDGVDSLEWERRRDWRGYGAPRG